MHAQIIKNVEHLKSPLMLIGVELVDPNKRRISEVHMNSFILKLYSLFHETTGWTIELFDAVTQEMGPSKGEKSHWMLATRTKIRSKIVTRKHNL